MLVRPSSAIALLLTGGLVSACQSTGADPTSAEAEAKAAGHALAPGQTSDKASDHASDHTSDRASDQALGSPRLELRFRPSVGASWIEEAQTDIFSHRSDQLPPDSPTLRTTRTERFEVLAQDAGTGAHRLEITLTALRLAPADGPVFDSRDSDESRDARSASASPLVLDHLSLLGIPLVYRLSDAGATLAIEDVEALRSAAGRRHAALREEAGLPAPTPEEDAQWRSFLDGELTKPLEWGIRPTLPTTPVGLGGEWTQEVQTSTLFNATARWPIHKRLETVADGRVTIHREADAVFDETPAMKRLITSAHATLEGQLVLDVESGALVRSETTVTGMIEAAPQPDADFAGGTLKLRSITKRTRLEGDSATKAAPADELADG